MGDPLSKILATTEAVRLATGFGFTEGPTWHPDGYYYFVDIRTSRLHRLRPGATSEIVREHTGEGNGTTFDLQGRLLLCEGGNRRVTRMHDQGSVETVIDAYQGKRLNRPNDIVCRSDGRIYFTDPGMRVPFEQRQTPHSGVYCIQPDGSVQLVVDCEYPNGLAFSPDEQILYVSNTRWGQYIHAIDIGDDGLLANREIFADMSAVENTGRDMEADTARGVPDGMKVDAAGNVYCTGTGGTWVFAPDGSRLGVIHTPEIPANLVFGGADLRTIFFTARTSVYTLRSKIPGLPHPLFAH
jgi:gluconolactonase